jgi:hypothetical protein
MTSGGRLLGQHSYRPLEAGDVDRGFAATRPLQLFDTRPGFRALPFARGHEGIELGAEEVGDVGGDPQGCLGGAFHVADLALVTCRARVGTLHGSRIRPAIAGLRRALPWL